MYVPLAGVSFGEGTTPQRTQTLQISKMYDGVSDATDFVLNVAADANAAMGFVFLHSGYHQEVDADDPTAIVTTSADGLVTDAFRPDRSRRGWQPGDLRRSAWARPVGDDDAAAP